MKRGALLRACFCQHERSVGKIKCRKTEFAIHFCVDIFPVESSGNHQMEDEKQFAFEVPYDLFPDASQTDHPLMFRLSYRRVEAAHAEGNDDSDFLEGFTNNSGVEAFDINSDVGKLGHENEISKAW